VTTTTPALRWAGLLDGRDRLGRCLHLSPGVGVARRQKGCGGGRCGSGGLGRRGLIDGRRGRQDQVLHLLEPSIETTHSPRQPAHGARVGLVEQLVGEIADVSPRSLGLQLGVELIDHGLLRLALQLGHRVVEDGDGRSFSRELDLHGVHLGDRLLGEGLVARGQLGQTAADRVRVAVGIRSHPDADDGEDGRDDRDDEGGFAAAGLVGGPPEERLLGICVAGPTGTDVCLIDAAHDLLPPPCGRVIFATDLPTLLSPPHTGKYLHDDSRLGLAHSHHADSLVKFWL